MYSTKCTDFISFIVERKLKLWKWSWWSIIVLWIRPQSVDILFIVRLKPIYKCTIWKRLLFLSTHSKSRKLTVIVKESLPGSNKHTKLKAHKNNTFSITIYFILFLPLTRYKSVLLIYTYWKGQKTFSFFVFWCFQGVWISNTGLWWVKENFYRLEILRIQRRGITKGVTSDKHLLQIFKWWMRSIVQYCRLLYIRDTGIIISTGTVIVLFIFNVKSKNCHMLTSTDLTFSETNKSLRTFGILLQYNGLNAFVPWRLNNYKIKEQTKQTKTTLARCKTKIILDK